MLSRHSVFWDSKGIVYKIWRCDLFSHFDIRELVVLTALNTTFYNEIHERFRGLPKLKICSDVKRLQELDPDFYYSAFILGLRKLTCKTEDVRIFAAKYFNERVLPHIRRIKTRFDLGLLEVDFHHHRFSSLRSYVPAEIQNINDFHHVLNARFFRALGCSGDPTFLELNLHAKLCLLSHIVGLAKSVDSLELAYIKRGINMSPTLGAFTQIQAKCTSEIHERWNPDVWTFYFLDTSQDVTYFSCGAVCRDELPIYVNRAIFYRPLPEHLKPSIYKDRSFHCIDIQQQYPSEGMKIHHYMGQTNLAPFYLRLHICVSFKAEEWQEKQKVDDPSADCVSCIN